MDMAYHQLLPLMYSLLPTLTLLLLGTSNGFTLELIHPWTNFLHEERIHRLVLRSIHRASYMTSTTDNQQEVNLNIARPPIDLQDFAFIVKIGIGTFKSKPPFQEYYLDMDTGSSLTWMQCQGCTACFRQKPGPFTCNKSTSFRPILGTDKKPLPYKIRYQDGTYSSGIYAKETIHLNTNTGGMESFDGFVFGCGLENMMDYGDMANNRIAGIMGLGWKDHSFLNQIKESKGRFSYCLPLVGKTRPRTYLRFGDDIIVQRQKVISVPMIMVEGTGRYYVGLQGISINKKRLNISQYVFDGPREGKGGCVIDSGTSYSRIVEPAYLKLREGLVDHFSTNKNLQRITGRSGLDLCYERRSPEGFRNLPEITFHFQGSNGSLVIRPEGGFEVVKRFWTREYFCLAMMSSISVSIIGAHQQTNQRIIYDTVNKQLKFYPEDCAKNS